MSDQTPLQARYNGGMLGFFLSAAATQHVSSRYPALRTRINQFLEEIGALPIMPPDQPSHAAVGQLLQEAVAATQMFDADTGSFAVIAGLATFSAIFAEHDPDQAAEYRRIAATLMEKFDLPADLLDTFAEAVEHKDDGFIPADPLHSAGLNFLKALIEPLDVCDRTTFVAMPFAPPHDAYFAEFYQPVLHNMDLTGIRAWGGLSSENYQEIIHTLLRKSAYVLADLTTLNINVVHEIGLAEGMDKTTFLMAASGEVIPPSNLADLAIVRYHRPNHTWDASQIQEMSTVLSLGRLGAEMGL